MLLLLLAWIFLLLVSQFWGLAIIGLLNPLLGSSMPKYFFLPTWVGLLSYSLILLCLSLFFPLSIYLGIVLGIIGSILSLCLQQTRRYLSRSFRKIPSLNWFVYLILGVVASAYANRTLISLTPSTYDLGLYHFGLIKWLATNGNVPGLGLIHERFAFTSTWFALAAWLNHGLLEGRVYSFLGGLILWLFLLQLFSTVRQIVGANSSDSIKFWAWFNLCFLCLVLPSVLRWEMFISASPDLPIIFLTLTIIQTGIFLISHRNSFKKTQMPAAIPLFLAVGAVTIKLSAIPLLFACLGLHGFLSYWKWRELKLIRLSLLIGLPLLIWLSANFITSGCIAFPILPVCLPIPWALTVQDAASTTLAIRQWAQWSGITPANGEVWLLHWAAYEGEAAFLFLWSIGVFIYWRINNQKSVLTLWLMCIALIGISFILTSAPTLRFGLGYFVILPSFIAAQLCSQVTPLKGMSLICLSLAAMDIWMGLHQWRFLLILGILIVVVLTGRTAWKNNSARYCLASISLFAIYITIVLIETVIIAPHIDITQGRNVKQWLQPALLPAPPLIQLQTINFDYFKPAKGDNCWNAPLPCSPNLKRKQIELRDSNKGLRSGFKNSQILDNGN